MNLAVACESRVTVTYTGVLSHWCPFVPEVDNGRITITWRTAGSTLELHALAAWLGGFATDRISHEDITGDIAAHLADLPGITDVTVTTSWDTAGACVEVVRRDAVSRERVIVGGA